MSMAIGSEVAPVDLPRSQTGSTPQHLLTTLLADYWFGRTELLPSPALVRLVGEFGVTEAGGRTALSRLTRRGLLRAEKKGRNTYYSLTAEAAGALRSGAERVMSFGLGEQPWDGYWTLAAFSLPEQQRDVRHAVRVRLKWLGFASLYDGLWISPRADPAEVGAALTELGVATATVLRARDPLPGQSHPPLGAWDLDELRGRYAAFITAHESLLATVRRGDIGSAKALVARTELVDGFRAFPGLDPDLPAELLPPDWPRDRARALVAEIYDALGPLAEIRVRQIVGEFDPELADGVHYLTADEVVAGATPR
jgi:phenylacetic acid degradation operon negative regulatory protein